ncbi:hypothetical protein QNA08_05150 [Chelatococcus sp. SYSU_G07232]|uniref:Uncharacterized protein n=1 Tax=Chelatococcus albus TaxID=3047466 RepID=A0ABT7AE09_9HYPH|nr:hypothetical protein [Chelatococcus sp. SYSU_G07232]MDJ1157618.1 hypothetical protein [Chelatococcus sp. SYSU_G07232]
MDFGSDLLEVPSEIRIRMGEDGDHGRHLPAGLDVAWTVHAADDPVVTELGRTREDGFPPFRHDVGEHDRREMRKGRVSARIGAAGGESGDRPDTLFHHGRPRPVPFLLARLLRALSILQTLSKNAAVFGSCVAVKPGPITSANRKTLCSRSATDLTACSSLRFS